MIAFDKVQKGIAAYLDNEVMPALKDEGWKRVAAGAAISLALSRSADFIPILQENQFVKAMKLMDENGNIDVEALVPVLKDQLAKEPMVVSLPMMGDMTFHEQDIDKLYDYIRTVR